MPTPAKPPTVVLTLVCAAMFLLSPLAGRSLADIDNASANKIGIHLELRARLDSIELEKQTRKRQGLPIDDLEAAGARIRDSLQGMRGEVVEAYRADPGAFGDNKKGFSFSLTGLLPNLPEVILSFRPESVFDWVMVITGAVAVLSLVMLIFGILAGRRKRRGDQQERGKKKPVARKMDLRQHGASGNGPDAGIEQGEAAYRTPTPPKAEMPFGTRDGGSGDGGSNDNLLSLMEHLRKLSPQAPPPVPAATAQTESPFSTMDDDELPPMSMQRPIPPPPPPPPSRPKPPPEPPPPLIVNVPEPPPFPARDSSVGGEAPNINDLVISAAGNGMSEHEISRRYQVSVDQVRLILRMNRQY